MVLTLKKEYRRDSKLRVIKSEAESDSSNTAGLGLAVTLSYFIIVFYSLFTSIQKTCSKRCKIGSALLSKGTKSFTVSQAMFYSEKGVTFLSAILFGVLGTNMLVRKNFAQPEFKRIFCFNLFVMFPIIAIIFTFIGPNNPWHYPFVTMIFIGGTVTQLFILNLYEKYFENEPILDTYKSLVYTMFFFVFILILSLIGSFILSKNAKSKNIKTLSWLFDDILASSEYIHLILYGILIYIFSTFAALPDTL